MRCKELLKITLNNYSKIFFLLFAFSSVHANQDAYIAKHWATRDSMHQQMSAFAQQAYRETYVNFFTEPELQQIFPAEYFLPKPSHKFLVLVQQNKIVAFARLNFEDQDQLLLDKLYVARNYQGRGLGKALLYASFNQAANIGYRTVKLLVWTKNPKAISFYAQHGFVLSKELVRYYNNIGEATDEYDHIMIADLRRVPQADDVQIFEACETNITGICMLTLN